MHFIPYNNSIKMILILFIIIVVIAIGITIVMITTGKTDITTITLKDILNRRLQTVLVKKKLANTAKMARQLITHKKVLVGGEVVNKPSYIVDVELENKISIKPGKVKPKKVEEKKEEAKPEEKIEETEEKQNEWRN